MKHHVPVGFVPTSTTTQFFKALWNTISCFSVGPLFSSTDQFFLTSENNKIMAHYNKISPANSFVSQADSEMSSSSIPIPFSASERLEMAEEQEKQLRGEVDAYYREQAMFQRIMNGRRLQHTAPNAVLVPALSPQRYTAVIASTTPPQESSEAIFFEYQRAWDSRLAGPPRVLFADMNTQSEEEGIFDLEL